MSEYWVARWINEEGVRNRRDLRKALKSDRAWDAALKLAGAAAEDWATRPTLDPSESSIVAGRQLDLSGITACSATECLRRELDEGLSPVFQYFDRIVVEGLAARPFFRRNPTEEFAKGDLEKHSEIYLHAKEIGALPHLVFREKPHTFCENHYKEHAKDLGLPAALDGRLAKSVVAKLVKEGTFEATEAGHSVHYFFTHPMFHAGLAWDIPRKSAKKHPMTPDVMAWRMYRAACVGAVGDLALARELSLPLTMDALSPVAKPPRRKPHVEEVALALKLPVFKGATSEQILTIRANQQDEYIRFRAALTAAIREWISRRGDAAPDQIASDVNREFIAPAIADIRSRLAKAQRNLSTKTSFRLTVGVTLAAVGILNTMPIIVGAGVMAVASSYSPVDDYLATKKDVELSDMYFLWLASRRRRKHARGT